MSGPVPASFDPARVRAGLLTAMRFGEPNQIADKATFHLATESLPSGVPVDDEGVPFDPEAGRTQPGPTTTWTPKVVPCAVEADERAEKAEEYGTYVPSQVTITLMDPEYQQVKGFRFVVVGGDRFYLRSEEPVVALGTIDIHTLICVARDDG